MMDGVLKWLMRIRVLISIEGIDRIRSYGSVGLVVVLLLFVNW